MVNLAKTIPSEFFTIDINLNNFSEKNIYKTIFKDEDGIGLKKQLQYILKLHFFFVRIDLRPNTFLPILVLEEKQK